MEASEQQQSSQEDTEAILDVETRKTESQENQDDAAVELNNKQILSDEQNENISTENTVTQETETNINEIESLENLTNVQEMSSAKQKKNEGLNPIEDPLQKASKFLEKHQLLILFQNLTADIVLKRPPDPLDFMIEEIEAIQEQDRRRKGVFLKLNKEKTSELTDEDKEFGKEELVVNGF